MHFHEAMIRDILGTDDPVHIARVVRSMQEVAPELDRLSIPAFIALCQQADKELRPAA